LLTDLEKNGLLHGSDIEYITRFMNYNKLTKAQLIERIEELEHETVQYKWDSLVLESQCLVQDLKHALGYLYGLGCKARSVVDGINWSILKHEAIEINGGKTKLTFDW